ncbi:Mitochondrial transcription factor 1 [Modicella reniformis]|uniref:rRNA adenine N(6)-methyltransferase n=1 Tax=Modicella reniformis TaxID=1440133 RepID=A0A9P6M0R1_9FUNG|nr:Mitochondrial transcription factor 1 [Modicella reniformis]
MTIARPLLKSLPKLPLPELWPTLFKGTRVRGQIRVSVMTEELADLAAKKMDIASHPNRSIIELFPGPGQLTRSMSPGLLSVDTLVQSSEGRIQHYPLSPHTDPYDELLDPKNEAIPELKPQPWDKVHSDLMLVGSIPNTTMGDKVLIDFLMASMERIGIFSFGRIEMYMFCNTDTVKRLTAGPGSSSRNKVAIYGEASADIKSVMQPGAEHFHLPYDYELLRLVPHEKPKLTTTLEVTDYCLRNLFASRSHSLSKGIKLLGPGAEILLGRLNFDTSIKVKNMTLEQLNEVALKFSQWPLRPTVLYDDLLMIESNRRR